MNNTKSRTLVIIFLIGVLVFIIGKLLSGGLYFDSFNDFLFDITISSSIWQLTTSHSLLSDKEARQ